MSLCGVFPLNACLESFFAFSAWLAPSSLDLFPPVSSLSLSRLKPLLCKCVPPDWLRKLFFFYPFFLAPAEIERLAFNGPLSSFHPLLQAPKRSVSSDDGADQPFSAICPRFLVGLDQHDEGNSPRNSRSSCSFPVPRGCPPVLEGHAGLDSPPCFLGSLFHLVIP